MNACIVLFVLDSQVCFECVSHHCPNEIVVQPWQVVLQTVKTDNRGGTYVEDTVVHVSEERPSYNDAVAFLLEGARTA